MIHLRPNWSSAEFACRCGCGFGLKVGDMKDPVLDGLQEIRNRYGGPLFCVSPHNPTAGSGCRCDSYNRRIGGTLGSYHMLGLAADIWGAPVAELYAIAQQVPVFKDGGIGVYWGRLFVHVDGRGHLARWTE